MAETGRQRGPRLVARVGELHHAEPAARPARRVLHVHRPVGRVPRGARGRSSATCTAAAWRTSSSLTGDWHSAFVDDLRPDFDDPSSPVIGTEFTAHSVSSSAYSADWNAANGPPHGPRQPPSEVLRGQPLRLRRVRGHPWSGSPPACGWSRTGGTRCRRSPPSRPSTWTGAGGLLRGPGHEGLTRPVAQGLTGRVSHRCAVPPHTGAPYGQGHVRCLRRPNRP